MKNPLLLVIIIFSLLGATACEDVPKCQHGDPRPIFSDDLPMVNAHNFQVKGDKSIEEVSFSSGVDLEVLQSGCDAVSQEFRFTVQGNLSEFQDSMWMKEAVRQFIFLSELGEKQKPLEQWANAINQARWQMKLGEPAALSDDISVKIDKVIGRGESTLLVIMKSKN